MALVSENEQVTKQEISTDQSPENQDIVKYVNELFSRAKKHRSKYDRDWTPNYEFVIGAKQWPIQRPRWRFNEAVNVTWSAIMTELAIQTDVRPKFNYAAEEPSDEAFTKVLSEINDANWRKFNWNDIVFGLLFDAKIYKVGHAIIDWDQELSGGLGDVLFRNLDPFYCYWDPRAETINKQKRARYFIYAEPVNTEELKDKNPQFADKIKSDVSQYAQKGDQLSTQRVATTFDPYSVQRLPQSSYVGNEQYGGEPSTLLIRIWLRDDTLEEICEEMKDDAGEKVSEEFLLKKKYPRGRYIEICNNLLLKDTVPGCEVNGQWVPYEFDFFPIVKCLNYSYPREYLGEDEVSQVKGLQKVLNYIWSYALDTFKMNSNPVTLISNNSGIDPDKITNEPNVNIFTNDMNGYRKEPGMALAPNTLQLLQQAENLFDKVQGLQDVSRGAQQVGATSGIMLEGYVEAAQTRPRMKNRFLDSCLQDAGEIILKFYLQFYKQPRVYRITNKDGYPEYVQFCISDDGKQANVLRTDQNGQQIGPPQENVNVKGEYDVQVVSGSALPFSKAQKGQTALAYFNAGAIDQTELLNAVDWPNKEQVIARMQKEAAQMAQQKAQQGK